MGCTADVPLTSGTMGVRLRTEYPWDGQALIAYAIGAFTATLRIRIPGWVEGHPMASNLYYESLDHHGRSTDRRFHVNASKGTQSYPALGIGGCRIAEFSHGGGARDGQCAGEGRPGAFCLSKGPYRVLP